MVYRPKPPGNKAPLSKKQLEALSKGREKLKQKIAKYKGKRRKKGW